MTTRTRGKNGRFIKKAKPDTASISPEDVKSLIEKVAYLHVENTATTICTIVLKNGWVVTGESGCINPEMYSAEKSKEYAYGQALNKLVSLYAFHVVMLARPIL